MREYTIIYNAGNSEEIICPDKETLIREHFSSNISKFEREVALLKWSSLSTEYVEDIRTGKASAQIFTADVNPYGWRV